MTVAGGAGGCGATGIGTAVGSVAGGHAINLAAISAALAAAPDAEPDPRRRWIAGVSTGVSGIVLGTLSAALVALVLIAPAGVVPAVAGVALFATLGGALQQSMAEARERIPAVVTLIVAASGIALGGVGAAFWALIAGLVTRAVVIRGR